MRRTRGLLALAWLVLAGCQAPHRETPAEDCTNHMDDDGNGLVDCLDPQCMGKQVCTTEICNNNLDDDGDGRFDCADPDCAVLPMCGGGTNKCGNDTIDPGEDCDGAQLGGRTCITQGFKGGALACKQCTIDVSSCTNTLPESCHNGVDDDGDGKTDCDDTDCSSTAACLCGNGIIDTEELCDGTQLPADTSCKTLGFSGGTLKCMSDCQTLDTSMCDPPVCGNGSIETGEQCDDGNTSAGDGCSPTCQIEQDTLCTHALELHVGSTTGDTSNGTNGIAGTCLGDGGKEKMYTYTPATTGMVTIVLNSVTSQGIYVRSTCADTNTELACSGSPGGNSSAAVHLPTTAGTPMTVFVDSGSLGGGIPEDSSSQAGPFTLIVVQTP